MKNIAVLAFSALLLIACKKEETTAAEEAVTQTEEKVVEETAPETATTNTAEPATFGNKNVALNPPHGQPGHKCEIPVGAPLDGSGGTTANPVTPQPQAQGGSELPSNSFFAQKPATNQPAQTITPPVQQAQQSQPQSQTITPKPSATAQTTAPGFSGKPNPAHGQPGHRCDVAVGATLP